MTGIVPGMKTPKTIWRSQVRPLCCPKWESEKLDFVGPNSFKVQFPFSSCLFMYLVFHKNYNGIIVLVASVTMGGQNCIYS